MIRRRHLLGLMLAAPGLARAQGFAGLGAAVEGYEQPRRGREIVFPADHGAHPGFRIEWWYLTANLTDATGRLLGLQWTLFRQSMRPGADPGGWNSTQFWLAHAAVTTADSHRHAERLARGGTGQAGVTASPFAAWIDDWAMESRGETFSPLRLTASGEGFSYDIGLVAQGPMVLQGDGGYSVKSERGQASHYVSQPFFAAEGRVTLAGDPLRVTGRAWMDREWSSQPLAGDQTGWDWFSLHLGSGAKVMLFRLRHADGHDFLAGNWIEPDGRSATIPDDGIRLTPLEDTEVAGRRLPVVWRVEVPERGLAVTARALNPAAWNATGFAYWEGPVTVEGDPGGIGYLEMTGYPDLSAE